MLPQPRHPQDLAEIPQKYSEFAKDLIGLCRRHGIGGFIGTIRPHVFDRWSSEISFVWDPGRHDEESRRACEQRTPMQAKHSKWVCVGFEKTFYAHNCLVVDSKKPLTKAEALDAFKALCPDLIDCVATPKDARNVKWPKAINKAIATNLAEMTKHIDAIILTIVSIVSKRTGVPAEALFSSKRGTWKVSAARNLTMALVRTHTGLLSKEVGTRFNRGDIKRTSASGQADIDTNHKARAIADEVAKAVKELAS